VSPPQPRKYNLQAICFKENARKTKGKFLHCLGFPWWNPAFSKGYQQKNKKISPCLELAHSVALRRHVHAHDPSPQAAERDESIANSLAWNPVFANEGELNF
jgi:hypothetical protein